MSRNRYYRGRRTIARPDNAVRTANDLVSIGQAEEGWKVLHDIITSKSKARFFQAEHEAMMKRYVELSVDLKKNARDGLYRFKSLCTGRNGSIGYLEVVDSVLRHYLKVSQEAGKKELDVIKTDVENEYKEDSKHQDSTDEKKHEHDDSTPLEEKEEFVQRQFQSPVLKYQWDTMKTTLDVSRNNMKLQKLYNECTKKAIDFCQKLNRTSEFRKLTSDLRYHLKDSVRYSSQENSISLKNPETLAIFLKIRFDLLRSATALRLWTEAYKLIEDIHALRKISEEPLEPVLLRTYYEKLAEIFWESKNYLFHAHCYHRYYDLSVESKVDNVDEIGEGVILAALSINRWDEGDSFSLHVDDDKDKKLGEILGLDGIPRRSILIKNLIRQKLIDPNDKNGLYFLLEKSFYPLQLTKKVMPLVEKFHEVPSHAKYAKTITNVLTYRLLEQLSDVYETFKFSYLDDLLPEDVDLSTVEKLIVISDGLTIKVDHQNGLLLFGDPEMESKRMRSQLTTLAKRLNSVIDKITPDQEHEKKKQRETVFRKVKEGCEAERKLLVKRLIAIEQAKQKLEREREERRKKAEEDQRRRQEEEREKDRQRRIKQEQEREQRSKARQEIQEQARKKAALQAQIFAEKVQKRPKNVPAEVAATAPVVPGQATVPGQPALPTAPAVPGQATAGTAAPTEEEDLDQLQKELRDLRRENEERVRKKMRDDSQRHDYLVRSYRDAEKKLLQKEFQKQMDADKEHFKAQAEKNRDDNKRHHEFMLHEKRRLAKMHNNMKEYHENMMGERRHEYEQAKRKQQARKEEHDKKRAQYLERIRLHEEREEQRRQEQEEEARKKREVAAAELEEKRLKAEQEEIQNAAELRERQKREDSEKQSTRGGAGGSSAGGSMPNGRPSATASGGEPKPSTAGLSTAKQPWRPRKLGGISSVRGSRAPASTAADAGDQSSGKDSNQAAPSNPPQRPSQPTSTAATVDKPQSSGAWQPKHKRQAAAAGRGDGIRDQLRSGRPSTSTRRPDPFGRAGAAKDGPAPGPMRKKPSPFGDAVARDNTPSQQPPSRRTQPALGPGPTRPSEPSASSDIDKRFTSSGGGRRRFINSKLNKKKG